MTNGYTKKSGFISTALLGLVLIMTSGCISEPKRVEADFGNSVNQTVQAATYNPEAAASTESIPVLGMDGKRSIGTLDALKTDTDRPEEFQDLINIDLGD